MKKNNLFDSISNVINSISPLNKELFFIAQAHLDNLTKPKGSLGKLETIASQLYAIQNGVTPLYAAPAKILTIAADHGVVDEGIASMPQKVTVQMVNNFLAGGAGINVLCQVTGIDLDIVDVGVKGDLPNHKALINMKVAHGTANMAKKPAMTEGQCLQCLTIGINLAHSAADKGYKAIGLGEMGIGNTTSSSALLCAFFDFSPEIMAGMGAGSPPKGIKHKAEVIAKSLILHKDAVTSKDPVKILSALGGLEIAAMSGAILGASSRNIAVMIDGFIATAAYVVAEKMCPLVRDYCFFSHGSAELGHKKVLELINETPLLDLGMRLGEGTGAALGLFLLKAAAAIYNDMATFEEAGVVIHLS